MKKFLRNPNISGFLVRFESGYPKPVFFRVPLFARGRPLTSSNLYDVPIVVSNKGSRRISIVLANTINKVLKIYTNFNFKDFKEAVLSSLSLHYIEFSEFILKES